MQSLRYGIACAAVLPIGYGCDTVRRTTRAPAGTVAVDDITGNPESMSAKPSPSWRKSTKSTGPTHFPLMKKTQSLAGLTTISSSSVPKRPRWRIWTTSGSTIKCG